MTQNLSSKDENHQAGDAMRRDLVHVFGHRVELSLDERMRFRLPDQLANAIAVEMGRVSAHSNLSPAAIQKPAFYFAPGTEKRIFLYPAQNIQVAIERFESPPPGVEKARLRAARDYFYSMMEFVEVDRQNRLQIPAHLQEHAELNEENKRIVVVAHNLWLSITSDDSAEDLQAGGREAFEDTAPDVLDPVETQTPAPPDCHDGGLESNE